MCFNFRYFIVFFSFIFSPVFFFLFFFFFFHSFFLDLYIIVGVPFLFPVYFLFSITSFYGDHSNLVCKLALLVLWTRPGVVPWSGCLTYMSFFNLYAPSCGYGYMAISSTACSWLVCFFSFFYKIHVISHGVPV